MMEREEHWRPVAPVGLVSARAVFARQIVAWAAAGHATFMPNNGSPRPKQKLARLRAARPCHCPPATTG
jgi:hypothetical protein